MKKYNITNQQLPLRMQRYLSELDNTRGLNYDAIPAISSAFRGLIATARAAGLPAKLSLETGKLFINTLRNDGWKKDSIIGVECILRQYAYVTDEGIDWALASSPVDRRPLECVFRGKHWSPYRSMIGTISAEVKPNEIRLADRWLRHRAAYKQCDPEVVSQFGAEASALKCLARFMTNVDPENLDTRYLQQASRAANSTRKSDADKRQRRSASALPEHFEAGMLKVAESGRVSNARQKAIRSALRRLVKTCEANGAKVELTMETARLYVEGLFVDNIANISRAGFCDFLACFAKYAGYPNELHRELMAVQNALKFEANQDIKKKEIKLAHIPISLAEIAALAFRLREEASQHHHPRNRWRDYTLSAVLALLSKAPLRTLDLRLARVGHEFMRDSEGWSCNIETSKTGTTIQGRLAEELTPYLDTALLHETSDRHLWTVYEKRKGTTLFGNPGSDWRPFGKDWLRYNMDVHLGHSPHIVRTLIHDELPYHDDLDLSVAQALCGHAHETSRKAYEVNAPQRRRQKALAHLSQIQESTEAAEE